MLKKYCESNGSLTCFRLYWEKNVLLPSFFGNAIVDISKGIIMVLKGIVSPLRGIVGTQIC